MEYIYATLTLNELEQELNQENITRVLEAAGADVIESRVKAIVAALEDVDIEQLGVETGMLETQPTPQVMVGGEAAIGSTDVDTDAAGATPDEATPGEAFVEELFDEDEPETHDQDTAESDVDDDASTEDSVETDDEVDDEAEHDEEPVAEEGVDGEEASFEDLEEE